MQKLQAHFLSSFLNQPKHDAQQKHQQIQKRHCQMPKHKMHSQMYLQTPSNQYQHFLVYNSTSSGRHYTSILRSTIASLTTNSKFLSAWRFQDINGKLAQQTSTTFLAFVRLLEMYGPPISITLHYQASVIKNNNNKYKLAFLFDTHIKN